MKKFYAVIGNPPYQETTDSDSTRMPPIYDSFMDEAYKVSDKVELITPARFLFDAGYTPHAWNEKMLNDSHFKVIHYETDSQQVFPGVEIKGGVAITYRDINTNYGPIGIFTKFDPLNAILKKVRKQTKEFIDGRVSSPLNYQLTDIAKKENPSLVNRLRSNAFTALSSLFHETIPNDGRHYITIIGLGSDKKRTKRYVRADYINDGKGILNYWNLLLPKSNGTGTFGESLSATMIAPPETGHLQTFISIGAFDTQEEALNAQKYIRTKFVRAMLGVLKVTQDNPSPKWRFVPLQDFSPESDIDWSQSVSDIDKQLYRKYGLTPDEASFIESHVKEMD